MTRRAPEACGTAANAVAPRGSAGCASSRDVRIYDLMGREVWRVRPTAGGSGEDTLALRHSDAPTALRPGLYLLRVEDVAGHTAETAEFVVLR
jgi:hypothetical protein